MDNPPAQWPRSPGKAASLPLVPGEEAKTGFRPARRRCGQCVPEGRGTRERTDRRWGRDDPVARCDNFGVPASAYVSICKSEKGNRRASASSVATMTRGGCKITELANLQGISKRWAPPSLCDDEIKSCALLPAVGKQSATFTP